MAQTPILPRIRRCRGFEVEEKVVQMAVERGYRVLARNLFFRAAEIDLILETSGRKKILVFVEVRSRTGNTSQVSALESVNFKKQEKIKWAAAKFLAHYRGTAQSCRFDVVAIQGERWDWIERAFE